LSVMASQSRPFVARERTMSNGHLSFAEKSMMSHKPHAAHTDHPNIPQKYRLNARKTILNRMNTARNLNFSRTSSLGDDSTTDAARIHYTPDWFKISIKTVDRDESIEPDKETQTVTARIQEVCALRDKWLYAPSHTDHIGATLKHGEISIDVEAMKDKLPASIADKYTCKFEEGIMKLVSNNSSMEVYEEMSFDEYMSDLQKVMDLMAFGPAKTMCYRRLKILQSRFVLHNWLNDHVEVLEVKSIPHRDFYNVRKIDNHVHHSACMHQKHLLRFIKQKLEDEPDTVCFKTKAGKEETLKEVFVDIGMTGGELNIDALDMHAHQETFQRFDKFNAKYNPVGKAQLRTIFLKVDNLIQGRYLAEVTKEVFEQLEDGKYQFAEYRLSVYGRKKSEWDTMGDWICNHKLYSENVRWMIQMPRIYNVYKQIGIPTIKNFNDLLQNFFEPLFDVTLNPASHPSLHLFLQMVVGFDSVDDESQPENKRRRYPTPAQWHMKENPPYIYYMYYMYANICKLNRLREERGMNTFSFRPHCGEAGNFDHLASSFLVANSINHGIVLKQAPVLQYIYYLKQIGIAMSPLSNNILFTEYDANPFPIFFRRGLKVTLSTDDPLLIHYTKDALLEEYSIAAQVYNLSSIDLCEIARNSVEQCGFDESFKQKCIGDYHLRGAKGNDIYGSNVPDARMEYRDSILQEEENFIRFAGYPQQIMRKNSLNTAAEMKQIQMNAQSQVSQQFVMAGSPPQASLDVISDDEEKTDYLPYSPTTQTDDQRRNLLKNTFSGRNLMMTHAATGNTSTDNLPRGSVYARTLAGNLNMDATEAPPHDEWVKLAQEKQRLEIIRRELVTFLQQNRANKDNVKGFDELERSLTDRRAGPNTNNLQQSRTSHSNMSTVTDDNDGSNSNNNKASSTTTTAATTTLTNEASSSGPNLMRVKTDRSSTTPKEDVEKAKQRLLHQENADGVRILDIRGTYFDEHDAVNTIDQDFKVTLANSNSSVQMRLKPSSKNRKNKLEIDLVESKQESLLENSMVELLLPSDAFENQKQKPLKCELDGKSGELIWSSGVVWFKNEWNLLVGAWADPENNLIEIKADNTLRYIDGFGPFQGEFVGFRKFRVLMPNGQYMVGNLLGNKEIEWSNGEKWQRCSDKGCLIM